MGREFGVEVNMAHGRPTTLVYLTPAVLAGWLGSVLGCAPADEPVDFTEALAAVGQPIQGGYVDSTDTAVVGVVHAQGYNVGTCTGSLLASNVVLTAQHCVADLLNSVGGGVVCGETTFGSTYGAHTMYVTTETTLPQGASGYVRGMELFIPPGGSDVCGNDQAILILEEPLDPAEAVPLVPRVDVPLVEDEVYSAIGYGATSDDPYASSGTRYRRDDLLTYCVADDCPSYYVYETEWVGETGICQGDSGGAGHRRSEPRRGGGLPRGRGL